MQYYFISVDSYRLAKLQQFLCSVLSFLSHQLTPFSILFLSTTKHYLLLFSRLFSSCYSSFLLSFLFSLSSIFLYFSGSERESSSRDCRLFICCFSARHSTKENERSERWHTLDEAFFIHLQSFLLLSSAYSLLSPHLCLILLFLFIYTRLHPSLTPPLIQPIATYLPSHSTVSTSFYFTSLHFTFLIGTLPATAIPVGGPTKQDGRKGTVYPG